MNIKPCRCGNTDLHVYANELFYLNWIVIISCRNPDCIEPSGVGFSRFKKLAYWKAVRDWNRGKKNG